MKIPLALLVLFIFFIQSCETYSDTDFNLTDTETKNFAPFIQGDTLYFESSDRDIDTFLVTKFDTLFKKETGTLMATPAFNTISVSLRALPIDNYIHGIFKNEKENRSDTEYNPILSITKYPQSKATQYLISFKKFLWTSDSGFGLLHSSNLAINNCIFKDYYIIPNKYEKQDTLPSDISEIFWTINSGIVAYKYNNGTIWTKKNCN